MGKKVAKKPRQKNKLPDVIEQLEASLEDLKAGRVRRLDPSKEELHKMAKKKHKKKARKGML